MIYAMAQHGFFFLSSESLRLSDDVWGIIPHGPFHSWIFNENAKIQWKYPIKPDKLVRVIGMKVFKWYDSSLLMAHKKNVCVLLFSEVLCNFDPGGWNRSEMSSRRDLLIGGQQHVSECNPWHSRTCTLCMCPANERRRYIVTSSLIGWAHAQNDSWAAIHYSSFWCGNQNIPDNLGQLHVCRWPGT